MSSIQFVLALLVATAMLATHSVDAFCAFVATPEPSSFVRTKHFNLTRKCARPAQAGWDQVDVMLFDLLDDECDGEEHRDGQHLVVVSEASPLIVEDNSLELLGEEDETIQMRQVKDLMVSFLLRGLLGLRTGLASQLQTALSVRGGHQQHQQQATNLMARPAFVVRDTSEIAAAASSFKQSNMVTTLQIVAALQKQQQAMA